MFKVPPKREVVAEVRQILRSVIARKEKAQAEVNEAVDISEVSSAKAVMVRLNKADRLLCEIEETFASDVAWPRTFWLVFNEVRSSLEGASVSSDVAALVFVVRGLLIAIGAEAPK